MSYDPQSFWDDRAQTWVNEPFQTETNWEAIKEFVRTDLPTLEIGCGQGRWSPYFAKYTGYDIAKRLIAAAEELYDKPEDMFPRFICYDIRKGFPEYYPKNAQVFTYTALEHIPPADIAKIHIPVDLRLVLVEPHGPSGVEHCFEHDYYKLFGAKAMKVLDQLTVYVREA